MIHNGPIHAKFIQETPTEQYLKCVTVVALIPVLFWFPPALSALRILACATSQVWCHPSACHWMDDDVFAIRGAVCVEHDATAMQKRWMVALHCMPIAIAQQLSYRPKSTENML